MTQSYPVSPAPTESLNQTYFLLAADRLDVVSEDCIVVEDSSNGMIAAQRAGMKWIGFSGAKIPPDVSRAPFVFSDYRTITPEQSVRWYLEFPAVELL